MSECWQPAQAKRRPIASSEAFERFGITTEGPVNAVCYTDIAASLHSVEEILNGAGAFLPMVIGMAGVDADPEELRPVQELVALLPDVGKIIAKFDFMQAKLHVSQDGPTDGTWVDRASILIRAPGEATQEEVSAVE